MNHLAIVSSEQATALPVLIDRAVRALSNARSSAEILEARELASIAYDTAKIAARMATAKGAHDRVVAAAHRAQADALVIEAQAKRRLADEYDAAQARGEVATGRDGPGAGVTNGNAKPTVADLGISRKQIHDAREVRDAEEEEPGIVQRVLDEAIENGEEPTRAKVKRAIKAKSKRRRPAGHKNTVEESQHDRDLRMLFGVWSAACESARQEFLATVTQ